MEVFEPCWPRDWNDYICPGLKSLLWLCRVFINIQCCLQVSFVLEVTLSDVALVETRFLNPQTGLFGLRLQLWPKHLHTIDIHMYVPMKFFFFALAFNIEAWAWNWLCEDSALLRWQQATNLPSLLGPQKAMQQQVCNRRLAKITHAKFMYYWICNALSSQGQGPLIALNYSPNALAQLPEELLLVNGINTASLGTVSICQA